MSIRREQGLLLVVALLGVWIWSSGKSAPVSSKLSWDEKEYGAGPVPLDPLVAASSVTEPPVRDPFREPSESSPLDPRALPFPELGPLPVVMLPLSLGQSPQAYHKLRMPGAVTPYQLDESVTASEQPIDTGDNIPVAGGGEESGEQYDRIRLQDGREMKGFIRQPDKYGLVGITVFAEPIIYDRVGQNGNIIVSADRLEGDQVQGVRLADTLRNRIELRRRSLGTTPASLPDRRVFIEDLLREARGEPWIYEVAAAQAREYVEISDGSVDGLVDGYRLVVQVMRDRGDVRGEWKLYSELPKEVQESSFYARSRGEYLAILGLVIDAEASLRAAVDMAPSDPRSRMALANFLLDQHRPNDALAHAVAARRNRAVLVSDEELMSVWTTVVRAHLAVGEVDEARNALSTLPIGSAFAARRETMRGSVEYAAGDWAQALSRFATAVGSGGGGEAAMGMAACMLALEQWDGARAGLAVVAARYPLLRHRAFAGLGLLYEKTGNGELALDAMERAMQADPTDPYVLYLYGRQSRLGLDYSAAVAALEEALKASDELIEVHAELASAYLAIANEGGAAGVEALDKARRHVDRLVERDADRGVSLRFRELQGIIRFWQGDYAAARATFSAAAKESPVCRVGVALVEYRQNHVQESRGLFSEMRDELRTGNPMRAYAESTIALIDDHAEKEQVRDNFDRDDIGRSWESTRNGGVGPVPDGESLRVRGRMSRPGQPVSASRSLPTGGNFLASEVSLLTAPGDRSRLAVMELKTAGRSGSTQDFRVRFGVRQGKPFLLIEDGDVRRARDDEQRAKWDPVELEGLNAVAGEPVRIELRVVERSEGDKFSLQAFWNGQIAYQRDVEKLRRKTSLALSVNLVVEGAQGDSVDVSFDDFRMVRRRER